MFLRAALPPWFKKKPQAFQPAAVLFINEWAALIFGQQNH